MNQPDVEVLPYPLQRSLMRSLAIPAQKSGRGDLLALWEDREPVLRITPMSIVCCGVSLQAFQTSSPSLRLNRYSTRRFWKGVQPVLCHSS